jgi:translation initiation factor IF-2
MMIKYRVHEVAKDLDVPSKDVIDLLGSHFSEPHKHMTALTEDELDIVFEHYTKERAVDNFDAYFAAQPKEPAQPAQAEPQAPAAAQAPAATQAPAAKPAAANTAAQGVQAKQPAASSAGGAAQAPGRPGAQRVQQGAPAQGQPRAQQARPQAGGIQRPAGVSQSHPFQKHQAKPGTPQTRVNPLDRTVRRVDTRGSQVELDKYNEHYSELAPNAPRRRDTGFQGKQKIKQRSQERRPAGVGKRETEGEKLKRLALEKARKAQLRITIPDEISVGELSARLKTAAPKVIKKLMSLGVMASVSQTIDYDTAAIVAMDFGAKVEKEVVVTIEEQLIDQSDDSEENLQPRCPVVCVMGHVDHGKTSLLDAIRNTNVAEGEAGGITQRIGAYRIKAQGRDITFLDTPGHEAFTSMRARGALATDIAVLVVAADDGIMPQTVEAINHAKAAKVPIIVAINKIDKPGADPEKVKTQLTEHEIVPEEWGGDTVCVPISAKTHQNIDKLLEMILLVADLRNLRANPDRAARGVVLEARVDKGRGVVASLLVQNGTLKTGDVIIAGMTVGHVRVMTDENGREVEKAGPSVPVEVTGLSEVPEAGDIFNAVSDERMARELVDQRRQKDKEEHFKAFQKVTLDNLFEQMQQGDIKEFNVIVKADVQGSVEAVSQSLAKLSNDEVRLSVIHGGVGAINESDVRLADASNAIIIGFNVRPEPAAADNAAQCGVEMRMYRVIYDCINEIESAMKGMLAPKLREVIYGRAEVRQVYKISSVGTIAGCYVLDGKVVRNSQIRVVRDGIVITEDKIDSLKRFKDDAKEVQQGFECGIGLDKFNDIKTGDIFESFAMEEYHEE